MTRWRGPGYGWVDPIREKLATGLFDQQFGAPSFQDRFLQGMRCALGLSYDEFCAWQFPGITENSMSTKFKFPLGALVVLSTSFALAAKQTEDTDREIHLAAERQASRAKDEAYRVAGRSDLIPPKAYAVSDKIDWATASLVAMDPPIEAGKVIARSEYLDPGVTPQYMVRYRAGDGRQTEAWFGADAIDFDPRYPNRADEAADPTPERIRSDD